MEKEFVNYNQALKLKELGFNEHCLAWYDINNILFSDITIGYEAMDYRYIQEDMNAQQCTAPTFSQAFRWFREKYCLQSWIPSHIDVMGYECGYRFCIHQEKSSVQNSGDFKTYEEAQLACLDKLIEIVESKSE